MASASGTRQIDQSGLCIVSERQRQPGMKRQLFIGGLFFAALIQAAIAATPGEVLAGQVLRDSPMQGLNAPSRKFSDFRGKPLIVNVWASWCGPCREEMASLERLAKSPGGKAFQVVGISTDDYPERAMALLIRKKITFENYVDQRLVLENMLGANRIPLTLLVDAEGRVLVKHYGAVEWDSPETMALIAKTFRRSK
ncbi:MAG: thiol-disulfide isomerase-like protein [uncultured bacterium]|nr:MAG: thiol-disulfide isomerase-like protein [uncultured bacterium]